MQFRHVFVSLVVLSICLPAAAWAAEKLPVQSLTLERNSANYNIKMLYPRTGHAVIDNQVAEWVKAQADWFAATAAGKQPQDPPYDLDVSYAVSRNDGEMFETLWEFNTYTGGAHPNHAIYTLNFLMPSGARFYLAEVLEPGGLARVSELATENLIAEIGTGPDAATTPDTIRMGTVAHPGAFESFTIMKDTLILYFSDYEVAPYAAGPQRTDIPIAKLRRVMRDRGDWGDPQPSFDCEKATTAVEKALCADVALARFDRRLAEAYWWKLQLADGDAGKAHERDVQRAFLAQRDSACTGQTGAALTQCLAGQYQQRLKPFDLQPD
jgi:uncharacterized protein YecT (DUF1311 family)